MTLEESVANLALDLLEHPYWLIACLIGLYAGIGLALAVSRDARRDLDAAWWRLQQDVKAQRIHRSARSIVSPDGPEQAA